MTRGLLIALAGFIGITIAVSLAVGSRQRTEAQHLHGVMAADLESGTFAGLRRAQALALRLAVADPRDGEAAAALAFAGAVLATEYGEPLKRGTVEMANRAAPAESAMLARAAEALVLLRQGHREAADREALAATQAAADLPQPLYVLGRVRSRSGEMVAASRALEAAMVLGPAFMPARLAWAEVRLDLGDPETAALALRNLPADAGPTGESHDVRALLLRDEGERALGRDGARCGTSRPASAFEAAGCALADAGRARLAGERGRARDLAVLAAELAPDEPRLLARTAMTLASLGAVDRAAVLVERAGRLAGPAVPALAWANVSVALGRGGSPPVPAAVRPPRPDGPLLEARAALASGGVGALEAVLDRSGKETIAADPDLAELSRLRAADRRADAVRAGFPNGPVHAYVDGLRARLAGDLTAAAHSLGRSLTGHGDACRAAGEYLAALRVLKQHPPDGAFTALRADSAGCVNLPRQR